MGRRDAPVEVVAALEERRPSLGGMIVQTEPKRHYPYGALVSHLLGYVGEISEEEMESGDIAGARLGALVGRGGLEGKTEAGEAHEDKPEDRAGVFLRL